LIGSWWVGEEPGNHFKLTYNALVVEVEPSLA
jgi:hypothetical protein